MLYSERICKPPWVEHGFPWFSMAFRASPYGFPETSAPHRAAAFPTAAVHSSGDFGISEKAAGGKDLDVTDPGSTPRAAAFAMDLYRDSLYLGMQNHPKSMGTVGI